MNGFPIRSAAAAMLAAFGLGAAMPAHADAVADFYKGKQISVIIGTSSGNDYDFRARLLARHMGRFIPGEPALVPRNMPGAGGINAANWLANVAPHDGTAIHPRAGHFHLRTLELLRSVGLEEAVQMLTQAPAGLIGLKDRGTIREGAIADLVIFDESRIGCGPTHTRFDLPGGAGRLYAEAEGIGHVIVNGREAIRGQELVDGTAGTILRSGRDTYTVAVR